MKGEILLCKPKRLMQFDCPACSMKPTGDCISSSFSRSQEKKGGLGSALFKQVVKLDP